MRFIIYYHYQSIKIRVIQSKPLNTASCICRRYIITAAHCLCGTVVKCNPELQSSNKVFSAVREPSLKRIKLVMGGGDKNNGVSSTGGIVSKVIHRSSITLSHCVMRE